MDNMYNNVPYPELYERLSPMVDECINRHSDELPTYMYPSENKMNEMVNEVYEEMLEQYPEIGQDPGERKYRARNVGSQQRLFFGRGRLARDLIALILLGRLFGRRRYGYGPGYGYGYGPGYEPGYGYGPGYGPGY